MLGFGCGNSDTREVAGWFRPSNRELGAFGTFQVKTKPKKLPQKTEAKMKDIFMAFVEGKASFQFFFMHR